MEKDTVPNLKTGNFNFSQIERYFLTAPANDDFQIVSDRTFSDLDLEDVFKFIDRTYSCVGQQYLYHLLRTIPRDRARVHALETTIDIFRKNAAFRQLAADELSKLHKRDAYYISSLFYGQHIAEPKWLLLIKILSGVSLAATALSFFFPKLLLLLLLLFPVNMGIHYWNKNNLYQYSSSIPQMLTMVELAHRLLSIPEFAVSERVRKSVDSLRSTGLKMSIFKMEARLQSEIGQIVDYLLELVKALFLVEPILLFSSLRTLKAKRQDINQVFHFAAEADAALSILALRASIPHHCRMDTDLRTEGISAKGMYHPLIWDSVSNDIVLRGQCALLTGSNMSGKTTFVRTVGINAILGQTINTCFANEFAMPVMKVQSAIRISDDLLDGKSYYLEEVITIKNLVEESAAGERSLILLDELFKGTNSVERIAIGKSVLSYLARQGNLVFVATHDRELADYLSGAYALFHFTEIVENETIHFDYKIKPGKLATTNAIRILDLNKFPAEIVDEAMKLSSELAGRGR
ncbi:MutS-related protein [Dyadobacter jiangsuensis]|uniref:MutS-like protein n=1 Tax=Dyadobacter jiangsuensis TaxID=1591085 RepID=A0A2P8G9A5_9BACT|nr:DNA mismatch repair protein MutS [Dyadobacter jiangsuensis]PSL30557.1 MutS-like protein [Dyadobacter jiangsuensis]